MNQFKEIHDEKPIEPPGEWNNQHSAVHFKSHTYPSKTSPVVSTLMMRLNHHEIDNGDVEVYNSDHALESTSDSVTYPDNTPIQ